MAFTGRFRVVLIRGAGMENLVVVQKLDISWLKIHIQAKGVTGSQLVEQIHGFKLPVGQPGNLIEALGCSDKVTGVDRGQQSGVVMKDRQWVGGIFSRRYFTFAIDVKRFCKYRRQFGSTLHCAVVQTG